MAKTDWFRNESWNDNIEKSFFERLNRCRSDLLKAQYLRIQAGHISKNHPDAAGGLLDLLFSKYPEKTELAMGYVQRAEILINKRELSEAIKFLRMALEQQRLFPYARTRAHLIFGRLVTENNFKELFGEVKNALIEFEDVNTFPIDFYESYGIAAIIAFEEGDKAFASELALKAINNADKQDSGFRFHKSLGLVETKSTDFHKKILNLSK